MSQTAVTEESAKERAVKYIRLILTWMDPDERLGFIEEIVEGLCVHCGHTLECGGECYCLRDD